MQLRPLLVHVAAATLVGTAVSAFTPARWLAASLWVSAAMLLTGALAEVEDTQPGAFENPDGSVSKPGTGLLVAKCAAIAIGLSGLGLWVQYVWLAEA